MKFQSQSLKNQMGNPVKILPKTNQYTELISFSKEFIYKILEIIKNNQNLI